jgi:hypothetical protein
MDKGSQVHQKMAMRVHLVLKCEDRLAAKARYVFSTFCKVLGLDLVEAERGLIPYDGPTVWYGAATDVPAGVPGLICIYASPEAPVFFASHSPRCVQDVTFVSWEGRRVPFLFAPGLRRMQKDCGFESFEKHKLNPKSTDVVHMPYDLIASAFYFLSCWEETVIPDRDRHGRFPYARSLAAQLDLPENIVDIYLDLFIVLLNLAGDGRWPRVEIPTWEGNVPFIACLTHDVDEIRKSRLGRLKFVWDHLTRPEVGHRHTPVCERARFALTTLLSHHDPYWTFPALAEMEQQFGFTASYFFQAGGRNGGARYSLSEPRIRRFVRDLLEDGFEAGLHGTYQSAFDEEKFLQEKAALAAVINEEPVGHRQHYLRMDYAATLPIYERAALGYDATLGYAEQEGYRNQFSYPYRPYHHEADRPYRFLELPTVIMDAALGGYRELLAAQAWQVIEKWLERTCARRGCITLLWHNPWDGIFPGYFDLYPRILTWIHDHGGLGLAGRDVLRQWVAR